MNSAPIAVAVSDVHFDAPTLTVAKAALTMALELAEKMSVPLIIAGDLNNTKAIIRAEVANAIIDILKDAKVPVKILVGNHDLVNEKGDEHGLNYLRPYAQIIDQPLYDSEVGVGFIPYQNTTDKVRDALKLFEPGDILIMHQGILGAHMGEYILDKASIEPEALAPFKCISGHYHRHQTVGTLTYIGSPYTTSFAEANDGPKGCLVLNSDGTFEQREFNLRRHVIIEATVSEINKIKAEHNKYLVSPQDLLWLKVSGSYLELEELSKKELGEYLFGHCNFKLDKICTSGAPVEITTEARSNAEILDVIIDGTPEQPDRKQELKALWRELLDEAT